MSRPSAVGPIDTLVTGGAGFIGGALVSRLRKEGATAVGADIRDASGGSEKLDVTRPEDVRALFARLRPRTVVHAAAVVDERISYATTHRVNVDGTRAIIDACRGHGVERLVHLSSIAAVGIDPGPYADESSPLQTNTGAAYFDTKAKSETLARDAMRTLPIVVIRPGDVVGPGSAPWVQRPLKMMRMRRPVLIDHGRGYIAHCWISNLVDAILLGLGKQEAVGKVFTIHDDRRTTYYEYFRGLADAGRTRFVRQSIPKKLAIPLARAADKASELLPVRVPIAESAVRYVCRTTEYSLRAAKETLGFAPTVDLAEAFHRLRQAHV